MHRQHIKKLFGVTPTVFRNTEMLYNNGVAAAVKELGFKGIVTEGVDWLMQGWRSPDFVYTSMDGLPVLLRNYRLSDDVGYRFSNKGWEGYPLTADKFAGWLAGNTDPLVLLAMDYEALGEHMWADTGIFDFLAALPDQVRQYPQLEWATPSQAVERIPTVGQIDVPVFSTISWADKERDTSAWLGNAMQQYCYEEIDRLETAVMATGDEKVIDVWRKNADERSPLLYLRQGNERRGCPPVFFRLWLGGRRFRTTTYGYLRLGATYRSLAALQAGVMFSRLDKYLLSEMLWPFVTGTALIVVMLVGNTLFPLIQQIVTYGIPFLVVAKLVACNIPTLIVLTLPAGTALASAWAINRMARDSEITVIRMAGVPLRRIFAPIYIVGFLASCLSFFIADHVVPAAQHEFTQIQQQMGTYAIEASPDVATDKIFNYQDYTFDIGEVHKDPGGDPDKLQLNNVIIFQKSDSGGFPVIISAKSAQYDHDIWTLQNVVVHDLGSNGFVRTEISGKTTTLNLRVPLNNLAATSIPGPRTNKLWSSWARKCRRWIKQVKPIRRYP